MSNYLKSPLNYTGNKYRILNQIQKFFPKTINCMVDLFCGGATVGLNANAKNVIFIDCNEKIINLLKYLSEQKFEIFLKECELIIDKYHLSYSYKYGYKKYRQMCNNIEDNNGLKDYNYNGFYKLREDYNALSDKNSPSANLMLYMLMIYGFNNDIRFNKNGEFNLPVGKTDFNKNNVKKVKEYISKTQNMKVRFMCLSFDDIKMMELLKNVDFVYMDPPYLLGNAVYNLYWNSEIEHQLLDFIDLLMKLKINFALSNVIKKLDKLNEPLAYWCHINYDKINIYHIDYNYKSASYNKIIRNAKEDEVLIVNKEYENEN